MAKAIAVTQQGAKTIFMIGEFQATLWLDPIRNVWTAEYFKKNRSVLTSCHFTHPIMPNSALDQPRADAIVRKVIGCLHAGTKVSKEVYPQAALPRSKRPSSARSRTPKVITAYQVIDRLLSLADDCTILVPMGKPAALKTAKVRIVDSEGGTLCEIPYPIFEDFL